MESVGSGLCAFPTMQQEILSSDVFRTTQTSLERSVKGGHSRQRQDITNESHRRLYITSHASLSVSSTCVWIYLYYFSSFHVCMLESSSTQPLACFESSRGSPAVFSCELTLTFSEFLLEGWLEKLQRRFKVQRLYCHMQK